MNHNDFKGFLFNPLSLSDAELQEIINQDSKKRNFSYRSTQYTTETCKDGTVKIVANFPGISKDKLKIRVVDYRRKSEDLLTLIIDVSNHPAKCLSIAFPSGYSTTPSHSSYIEGQLTMVFPKENKASEIFISI